MNILYKPRKVEKDFIYSFAKFDFLCLQVMLLPIRKKNCDTYCQIFEYQSLYFSLFFPLARKS